MYKKTNPQQSLFGVETQLSPSLKVRLKNSWAQLFRVEILPILLRTEDQFAVLYGKTGRPNFSVARMLGLCFLQELSSLNDQQTLDAFGFDIRWRYALDVDDQDAYLSRVGHTLSDQAMQLQFWIILLSMVVFLVLATTFQG